MIVIKAFFKFDSGYDGSIENSFGNSIWIAEKSDAGSSLANFVLKLCLSLVWTVYLVAVNENEEISLVLNISDLIIAFVSTNCLLNDLVYKLKFLKTYIFHLDVYLTNIGFRNDTKLVWSFLGTIFGLFKNFLAWHPLMTIYFCGSFESRLSSTF